MFWSDLVRLNSSSIYVCMSVCMYVQLLFTRTSFRTLIKQVEFSRLPSAYCLDFSSLNRQTSKNVIFLNDFNIIQCVPCTNNVIRLLGKVQLFIANKHRSTHCNIQSMKSVGKCKWIQEACLSRGTSLIASRHLMQL